MHEREDGKNQAISYFQTGISGEPITEPCFRQPAKKKVCVPLCVCVCVRHFLPSPHLQRDVGPVDAVVCNVEVERRCLLDTSERDGYVVVVGFEGDAPDVSVTGEEQEGFRDNARAHVAHELKADGTCARHTLWPIQAQMTTATIVLGACVCP